MYIIIEFIIYGIVFGTVFLFIKLIFELIDKVVKTLNEKMIQDLDSLFMEIDPKFIFKWTLIGAVIIFLFFTIIFRNYFLGLVLGAFTFFSPKIFSELAKKRRLKKFDDQLVDALALFTSSLKAGVSLNRALETVVKEMSPPISQEFGLVLKAVQLGTPFIEALEKLKKRIPSEDLNIVISATALSQETGGRISEVFERIEKTMRERNQLMRKLDALTSLGKFQGILTAIMPFLLGFVIAMLAPDIMMPFIEDLIGKIVITFGIILEIIGFFFIKKITTIEV